MKLLTSLYKFEIQSVCTLYARANKSKVLCKYASTDPNKVQTMFDLYAKNSHWMGVYQRYPLKEEPLTYDYIKERLKEEDERNKRLDLESVLDPQKAVWTPESKRVGAIGKKLGLSAMWLSYGRKCMVTVIQIKDCVVMDTQLSREDGGKDAKNKLVLGAGFPSEELLSTYSHEKMKWFEDRGIPPREYWARFEVTKDALLLPGTEIKASHFMPGQYVRVGGKTIDRGFQGVMKRWGMKGQPATHGQSKTHRKMGATGGGQDPGRIFPGKRMAGHMGNKWRFTKSLQVFRVEKELGIIVVKGNVPGAVNSYVMINDVRSREFPGEPPFPTMFPDEEDELEDDMFPEHVTRPMGPSIEFPPFKI